MIRGFYSSFIKIKNKRKPTYKKEIKNKQAKKKNDVNDECYERFLLIKKMFMYSVPYVFIDLC